MTLRFKQRRIRRIFRLVVAFHLLLAANIYQELKAQEAYYYGVSAAGGEAGYGYIFRFDEALTVFEIVYEFSNQQEGTAPSGSLLLANDGWLYGTTNFGGNSDFGTLYRFNPLNGDHEVIHLFTASDGRSPWGDLVQMPDNKIYGVAVSGGSQGPNGGTGGVIFSYDPTNMAFELRHSFLSPDGESEGYSPQLGLTPSPDDKLYGTCKDGGAFGHGTIFMFDPSGDSFQTVHDFSDGTDGRTPRCRLLLASNGDFYGTTPTAGPGLQGTIFRYDPEFNGFSLAYSFYSAESEAKGRSPQSYRLLETEQGVFYGTTALGGEHNNGTLFKLEGDNLDTLLNFGESNPILGRSLISLPDGRILGYSQEVDNSGSVIYTFNPFTSSEEEIPFQRVADAGVLPGLSLGFTEPVYVDLSTLSVIEKVEANQTLTIYPNPTQQYLYFSKLGKAEIFDPSGKRIYEGKVGLEGLPISEWQSGQYLIHFRDENETSFSVERFIKL